MKTATEVKKLDLFTGDARLFKCEPPMTWEDYHGERTKKKRTKYVVVSATVAMFSGPETYIFPANSEGGVVNWGELDGSFRGSLDHKRALENAGYRVVGAK